MRAKKRLEIEKENRVHIEAVIRRVLRLERQG